MMASAKVQHNDKPRCGSERTSESSDRLDHKPTVQLQLVTPVHQHSALTLSVG